MYRINSDFILSPKFSESSTLQLNTFVSDEKNMTEIFDYYWTLKIYHIIHRDPNKYENLLKNINFSLLFISKTRDINKKLHVAAKIKDKYLVKHIISEGINYDNPLKNRVDISMAWRCAVETEQIDIINKLLKYPEIPKIIPYFFVPLETNNLTIFKCLPQTEILIPRSKLFEPLGIKYFKTPKCLLFDEVNIFISDISVDIVLLIYLFNMIIFAYIEFIFF